MSNAKMRYRQCKGNEHELNVFFLRKRQFKCELVTLTKATYYKEKLDECGNDCSKTFGQENMLPGKN